MSTTRMNKQEAGKLGGLSTYRKYGREHMSEIGKRGAYIFHKRYSIQPVMQSGYAIVERETGKIVNFLFPGAIYILQ